MLKNLTIPTKKIFQRKFRTISAYTGSLTKFHFFNSKQTLSFGRVIFEKSRKVSKKLPEHQKIEVSVVFSVKNLVTAASAG